MPEATKTSKQELQLLTREQFTKPTPKRFETIDIPALGGAIKVMSLTDGERSAWELSGSGDSPDERLADIKRRLIVAASHSPKLLPEDVDAMAEQDSAVIDYVFERVKKHVGISDADVDELVGKPKAD